MMGYTHFAGGALAGAAAGTAFGEPLLGAAMGAVAGLMPDIDHPGSMLSRKIPVLPAVISALAGHRGLTHTIWFCLAAAAGIAAAAVSLAGWTWAWLAAVVLAGSLSHLILDGLTKSGVRPFAPLALPGRLARLAHIKGPVTTGTAVVEGPLAVLMLVLAMKVSGVM